MKRKRGYQFAGVSPEWEKRIHGEDIKWAILDVAFYGILVFGLVGVVLFIVRRLG